MGDFGLYAALSGTDNWAQKRQDKMSNLMMLERMEQRSERQLAAQMQAEVGIQEMLDKMSTFDVLPEDQKAIEQKEQEARLGIIKGITIITKSVHFDSFYVDILYISCIFSLSFFPCVNS